MSELISTQILIRSCRDRDMLQAFSANEEDVGASEKIDGKKPEIASSASLSSTSQGFFLK